MFCAKCGGALLEYGNYCPSSGCAVNEKIFDFELKKENVNFCKCCGNGIDGQHSYCAACGASLYQPQILRTTVQTIIRASSSLQRNGETNSFLSMCRELLSAHLLWQKAIICTAASLGIMLILSLIIGATLSDELNGRIIDELNFPSEPSFDSINFIGPLEGILLSNVIGIHLSLKSGMISGQISAHIGSWFLVCIPFLGFFTTTYFTVAKNNTLTIKKRVVLSIMVGIIYSILLSILSLFGGFSETVFLPFVEEVELIYGFSFFYALFNGFLFGFGFTMLGTLAAKGLPYVTSHLRLTVYYGEAIHQAIATVFRGLALSIVALLLIILINEENAFRKDDVGIQILALLQMGGYFWEMLNLSPIAVETRDTIAFSASVFSGIHADGNPLFLEDRYYYSILLAFLIPLGLFFWAGRQIKLSGTHVTFSLLVFSGLYALCMMIFSFITNGHISMQGGLGSKLGSGTLLEAGTNSFFLFLLCFIFSFVISYMGQLFTNHPTLSSHQELTKKG